MEVSRKCVLLDRLTPFDVDSSHYPAYVNYIFINLSSWFAKSTSAVSAQCYSTLPMQEMQTFNL